MSFNPVLLETKRLKLTGLSPQDISYIFENKPKEEIMVYLGHDSEKDYQKELYKYQNGYAAYNRSFILFLIESKDSKRLIGRCGLHNWNAEHSRAEIGYHMSDENAKRQGYMSEAVDSILEYGFNSMNLHRIEAMVAAYNTPSLKILRKFGFIQEGVLREHYRVGDTVEDSLVFSLLRKAYKN